MKRITKVILDVIFKECNETYKRDRSINRFMITIDIGVDEKNDDEKSDKKKTKIARNPAFIKLQLPDEY